MKRRKPKNKDILIDPSNDISNNVTVDISSNVHVPKKRGRKPKGGKIVTQFANINKGVTVLPNIILHLKCNISDVNKFFNCDLNYSPNINNIENYIMNCLRLFPSTFSVKSLYQIPVFREIAAATIK